VSDCWTTAVPRRSASTHLVASPVPVVVDTADWATAGVQVRRALCHLIPQLASPVMGHWGKCPPPRFLARDVIYTSRTYATMSVSVCLSVCPFVRLSDGSALAYYSSFRFQISIPLYRALRPLCCLRAPCCSPCGSSRAMLASARSVVNN